MIESKRRRERAFWKLEDQLQVSFTAASLGLTRQPLSGDVQPQVSEFAWR